jgi:hypothetical protein
MTWRFLLLLLASFALAGEKPPLEPLLVLPEPRALRTARSVIPEGAQATVFSPAREIDHTPGIEVYDAESFAKLGVSPDTFVKRAEKAADRLLSVVQPELIKAADGRVLYAVYRGERPIMASLVVAPALPALFEDLLGPEVWAVLPDRHSLYLFPAKEEAIAEFIADLAERYQDDAHAASSEIFVLKKGAAPRVVGSFID